MNHTESDAEDKGQHPKELPERETRVSPLAPRLTPAEKATAAELANLDPQLAELYNEVETELGRLRNLIATGKA